MSSESTTEVVAEPNKTKVMHLEEQIERLVAQFKADLLAQVQSQTKEVELDIDLDIGSTQMHRYCGVDKCWFHHGQIHRVDQDPDQPTIVAANGDKFWYENAQLHRPDGKPAIERANQTVFDSLALPTNGEQEWWVGGKCVKKLMFKTG